MRWALGVLAMVLVTTGVQAQAPIAFDSSHVSAGATPRPHFHARTACGGGFDHPHVEQLRELTAEQQAENAVHEAVHVRQLAVGCDSVMRVWDTDLLKRIQAEAEATCEGWKAGNVAPTLWHARSVRAAAWWARFTTVGYEDALAAFDRWCTPVPG